MNREEILKCYQRDGYAKLPNFLNDAEVEELNRLVDRDLDENPDDWQTPNQGASGNPNVLLKHPELDRYIRDERILSLVDPILGGDVRFAQFDFRDVPANLSEESKMGFHRDISYYGTVGGKLWDPKNPYLSTYVCIILYLKDVHPCCPCFCVAPGTHEYRNVEEAQTAMGEHYREDDIRGPAGTAVIYNITTHHARIPGSNQCRHGRRTLHCYYSRESNSPLTDWMRLPEELALHDDPEVREFYSQWSPGQIKHARKHYKGQVPGYYPPVFKL